VGVRTWCLARGKAIAASDFLTVEVWSWRGLITHYVLFVIEREFIGVLDVTRSPLGADPDREHYGKRILIPMANDWRAHR
jgi:hypothetical protein